MRSRLLSTLAALLFLIGPLQAQDKTLSLTIKPAKQPQTNVPVAVPLNLPLDWAQERLATVHLPGGQKLVGQLTVPGLMTEKISPSMPKLVRRDLHFILPESKPGEPIQAKVAIGKAPKAAASYAWKDKPEEYADLVFVEKGESRPVLRYMNRKFDDTTKEKRNLSYKVFHHLYDPKGKRFVTNAGHANENAKDAKKLLFPHHRGLMYAFNRINYGPGLKKKADTWHATGDAHQSHEAFQVVDAGPVLARHRVVIDWHGEKKEVFAKEEREVTVYNVPGGTLVEFVSKLEPTMGPVKLDGDPQHAGFQFRAHNDVAEKTAKQTYYLRPDGKGKPGETRNWEPKTKKGPVDLPWYALSFVLDGQRYTVQYLNSPTNPQPTRFSERDYGRFGGYFEYELTEQRPLLVDYRVWLQEGELTPEQARQLYDEFTNPPQAVVTR